MTEAELPLNEAIESFLRTHSMSPISFGRRALNDPHFVRQFRAGRRTWPETEAKVRQFMAAYRPQEPARAA